MRDLLRYWQQVAGATSDPPWTEPANVAGLFQCFRPHGDGVDRVLNSFPGAERVLPRLLDVYRATAPGWETHRSLLDYFLVHYPIRASEQHLMETARRYVTINAEILRHFGENQVGGCLAGCDLQVVLRGPGDRAARNEFQEYLEALQCDFVSGLEPLATELLLLEDAFFTMGNDNRLAFYVMWPIWSDSSPIEEPFAPYFELWKHASAVCFESAENVSLLIPEGVLTASINPRVKAYRDS